MPRSLAEIRTTIEAYCAGVESGTIPANRLIRLAVRRHRRDLVEGPKRGLRFDEKAGSRVIQFFGFLRHSKGEWAGKEFELSPWEVFILWVLFGWKRADGTRRFRAAYVEITRKNGKSTLAAGIGLYLFFADGEPGAEVYAAATKRDQARIVHGEAVRMVKASPSLRSRIGTFKDNLFVEATNSKFEPLGADKDTLDGLNVHGVIIDELHAHKNRGVLDVMDTATGARRQPLLVVITTAGSDDQSVCGEEHGRAVKVLEEAIEDDTLFAFIAGIDEDDDWTDPKAWAKANPNLNVSVKLDDLERKCRKAVQMPSARNAFKRLHLNLWTKQVTAWLDMEKWKACGAERYTAADLKGRECYGSMDLASTTDLTATAYLFPPRKEGERWKLLADFWIPKERALEKEQSDRVPYTQWERDGWIRTTPGRSVDYAFVRKSINERAQEFSIRQLPYDSWNARHLATELGEDGLPVVEFPQTISYFNEPCKTLEKMLADGTLSHGDNPVLNWMASNVSVKSDPNNNIRPVKPAPGSPKRIDGVVCLLMALGMALRNPETGKSVYETRGVVVI